MLANLKTFFNYQRKLDKYLINRIHFYKTAN